MMALEQAKTNKDYARLVNRIYHTSDFEFVGIAQETYYPFVIKWRFAAGNQSEQFRQIVLRKGIGIAGLVFRTGKPFYDNNLSKYNFSNKMYTPIANAESLWSAVAIPVAFSLETVNAVLLAGYRRKQPVSLETVAHLGEYLHG